MEIAENITEDLLKRFSFAGRDMRLLKKIVSLKKPIPFPGDLSNLIKTSIAFSDSRNEFNYLTLLLKQVDASLLSSPIKLKEKGFTLREIEKVTNISKSTLSREFTKDNK